MRAGLSFHVLFLWHQKTFLLVNRRVKLDNLSKQKKKKNESRCFGHNVHQDLNP